LACFPPSIDSAEEAARDIQRKGTAPPVERRLKNSNQIRTNVAEEYVPVSEGPMLVSNQKSKMTENKNEGRRA
jgi:hypothetical protein